MLGRVGQRFGDEVIGADLYRLRQSPYRRYLQVDGDRGAAGECPEGGTEAAIGQDRGVDAARGLAQLLQRASGLADGAVELGSQSAGGAASCAARRRKAREISRCWVPSCRSRSIRRRAWSAAATIRERDAVSSAYSWALSRETASWPAMSLTASSRVGGERAADQPVFQHQHRPQRPRLRMGRASREQQPTSAKYGSRANRSSPGASPTTSGSRVRWTYRSTDIGTARSRPVPLTGTAPPPGAAAASRAGRRSTAAGARRWRRSSRRAPRRRGRAAGRCSVSELSACEADRMPSRSIVPVVTAER